MGKFANIVFSIWFVGTSLAACASGDNREEITWSDTGGEDDQMQFDRELREKHLIDQQQRAWIAELAASKGNKIDGLDNPPAPTPGQPAPASGQPAPTASAGLAPCPDGLATYTCRCPGKSADWLGKVSGQAWQDPQGFIRAAAQMDSGKIPSMTPGRVAGRATAKILALVKGAKANAQGFPDYKISGQLRGVETLDARLTPKGQVAVLVRYKPEGWKLDSALLQRSCPKLKKGGYDCSCDKPVWPNLQAWVAKDGYVYGTGLAPDTGAHTEQRARSRATRSLVSLLSGMTMVAQPVAPAGGKIRSTSSADVRTDQIQLVSIQTLPDKGMAVLVRLWIGK
jgi:hypothetical protein